MKKTLNTTKRPKRRHEEMETYAMFLRMKTQYNNLNVL